MLKYLVDDNVRIYNTKNLIVLCNSYIQIGLKGRRI
jgi:hypothetical protein